VHLHSTGVETQCAVQALWGSLDLLPRITPTWDQRHLDLTEARYRFSDRAVPLAGIYLLDDRTDEADAPVIEAMKPREALLALVANTYANYLIVGDLRAEEFIQLEQLASVLPIRRVRPDRRRPANASSVPRHRSDLVRA
jgi:hypothetical protein